MSQMMFAADFMAIVRRVPGLRLACNDWTNKTVRHNRSIPEIGVYYKDDFICKADQDYMDQHPRVEQWTSRDTYKGDYTPTVSEAYRRSAWPGVMKTIEDHIPPEKRAILRKVAKRRGFRWYKA